MGIGLESLLPPERLDRSRRRLERGKRDHCPERVVHGRDAEGGCRDRRREVAAVVNDRVRAPLTGHVEQFGQLLRRMETREEAGELEWAPLLGG